MTVTYALYHQALQIAAGAILAAMALLILALWMGWRWWRSARAVEQGRTAYWHLMATARCALCGSQMELPTAAAPTLVPSPYDGPTGARR